MTLDLNFIDLLLVPGPNSHFRDWDLQLEGPPYPALPRILGRAWCSLDPSGQRGCSGVGPESQVPSPISQFQCRARSFRKLCVTHMENPAAAFFFFALVFLTLLLTRSSPPYLSRFFLFPNPEQASLVLGGLLIRPDSSLA